MCTGNIGKNAQKCQIFSQKMYAKGNSRFLVHKGSLCRFFRNYFHFFTTCKILHRFLYSCKNICLHKKINSSKAKNLQSGNSAVGCIFSKCVQYEHFWMEMGGFARDCMGVATYDISCNGQWLFVGPWKAT